MAHRSYSRFCNHGVLRLVLFMLSVCLVGSIIRSVLYWNLKNSKAQLSCPPCACDCSSEAILSLSLKGFFNSTFAADCGKHDKEMKEEMEKDLIALLSEELSLQKSVDEYNLEQNKALITSAKTTFSHYQKEYTKCQSGTQMCEETRENAEAELVAEYKLAALWEKRARELGWKDLGRVYTSQ